MKHVSVADFLCLAGSQHQRRLPLEFLTTKFLETALWPDLYPFDSWCDSYWAGSEHAYQSPRASYLVISALINHREAKKKRANAKGRNSSVISSSKSNVAKHRTGESQLPQGKEQGCCFVPEVKVRSSVPEYADSWELLHFHYDRAIISKFTARRAAAQDLGRNVSRL